MDPLALLLVAAGVVALAIGVFQVRGPLARIRQLDATQANLDRYETWRGKPSGVEADGPTGADIMRQQMRQRVLLWGALAVGGGVSILVGLLLA